MRRDTERLRDMLHAIEKIELYANRGRQAFNEDEMLQTWIVHHIELLGEAARGKRDLYKLTQAPLRNSMARDYQFTK